MESLRAPRLQASPAADIEPGSPPRKRPRKSRSKGLRTRSGCITCRKRHKKCDEVSPKCTNCCIAHRACIWKGQAPQETAPRQLSPGQDVDSGTTQGSPNRLQESIESLGRSPEEHRGRLASYGSDNIVQPPIYSPTNTAISDCLPADLASVKWLDLLAADAIQANRGFSRATSPVQHIAEIAGPGGSSNYPSRNGPIFPITDQNLSNERFSWQLEQDIVLKEFEVPIFRNFIDRAALWLDVFDPDMHFSIYATRLALRNVGLMKAIIALSAQHLSHQTESQIGSNTLADPNLAVQYYYETLHYVQTALQYNSYAHSEVILATALVISTYEMLDESDSGWKRHLKGVFWIQRSQNVNGASGGIRQAVWWAWLRQDIWAAFREKRRCFSFWKPVKDYPELNQHELLNRATYLLSQVVNYCADHSELAGPVRGGAADELFGMLDRWKSFLDESFKPLPSVQVGGIFQPIWIHPPKFGAALQIFYFARILLILHRPSLPGFASHLRSQKYLADAVRMICGIAMELKDEGCQITSSQCLYGVCEAGLCVQDSAQRGQIISLIDACEARTGWPMSTMREDLYQEWQKADSDD